MTQLAENFYNKVNTDKDKKIVEVVFVTHDRDPEHFKRHFLKMPWVSIPYTDDHKKATLGSKFEVSELPTLVVCDATGKVIKNDAREQVMSGEKCLEEWAEAQNKPAGEGDGGQIDSTV